MPIASPTPPAEKKMLPSFSIVMPCYNVEQFVEEALLSVFAQKYDGRIQYIIVDDGSTDNTWEVIQNTVQKAGQGLDVCLIQHEKNKGVSAATDTCYRHATGDWIIKADSDDVQLETRCAECARLITKYPQVGCIILSCQRMEEDKTPRELVPYCSCLYDDAPDEIYLHTPEQRFSNIMRQGPTASIYSLGCTTAMKRTLYERWGDLMADAQSDIRFSDDTVWGGRYILTAPVVGSRALACMYRTRSSGNLEYRSRGLKYSDFVHEELNSSRNMKARAEGYALCCRAAQRAIEQPELTDWTPEQIKAFHNQNYGEQIYFAARAEWWSWNWFKRLQWYRAHAQQLLPPHRAWCKLRLLPLSIVCLLKSMRKS